MLFTWNGLNWVYRGELTTPLYYASGGGAFSPHHRIETRDGAHVWHDDPAFMRVVCPD